jgi:hypothetical protein
MYKHIQVNNRLRAACLSSVETSLVNASREAMIEHTERALGRVNTERAALCQLLRVRETSLAFHSGATRLSTPTWQRHSDWSGPEPLVHAFMAARS